MNTVMNFRIHKTREILYFLRNFQLLENGYIRLVGFVGWLVGRLVSWLCWLVDWLVGWLVLLVGSFVRRLEQTELMYKNHRHVKSFYTLVTS